MNLQAIKTVNGHPLPEVVSALQKSIRRGQLDDALYFATDMYQSGYAEYAWKRLRIITSEDIGLANPHLPATVQALYETWQSILKKKDVYQAPERLFFVHAVCLLATSPKNRTVDDALVHHFGSHDKLMRGIPDYALDRHTSKGRSLGRGVEHVFEVGYHLDNQVGDNPYRELARATELTAEAAKGKKNGAGKTSPARGQGDLQFDEEAGHDSTR